MTAPPTTVPIHAPRGPRLLDMDELAERDPQPPQWLIPGWLPAGEVTLLAGNGGTGKSGIALELAVAVALGADWHGLRTQRRNVAYLSYEDCEAVLHWRLSRICAAYGVGIGTLRGRLHVYDGTTVDTAWYARGEHGDYGLTPAFRSMRAQLSGAELVVVDGSSDVFAGNENDRAQVKAFLRSLRTLIPADGALILLAHVDKGAAQAGKGSLGFSGSTGWNNGVRCRWYLFPETEGDDEAETGAVVLDVRKSNLGRSGATMTLRYDDDAGRFRRVDAPQQSGQRLTAEQRDEQDSAVLRELIRAAYDAGDPIPAATSGTRSAHLVLDSRAGLPQSLRGKRGKRRCYALLERMRAAREIVPVDVRSGGRNYVTVLRAT